MWLAAILGRLRGKRVYFWTHGWQQHERGLKALVRNTFYRLAHGLLLYGHYAKMIGLSHGFDPDRMHVIYNSLDYDRQRAVRGSLDADAIAARREACSATAPDASMRSSRACRRRSRRSGRTRLEHNFVINYLWRSKRCVHPDPCRAQD